MKYPTTTRQEIIKRANAIPRGSQYYSMETIGPHGYRPDCSGWVSYAWGIPPGDNNGWGGQSTVSLVSAGYMTEIPWSQLQPGDAIGLCGPGTAGGDGHIQLVTAVNHGTSVQTAEFCGDTWCPYWTTYGWGSRGYKAYRYVGVVDEQKSEKPEEEDDEMFLIQLKGKAPVFLTNGVTAVHVRDKHHLDDIRTLAKEGLIKLASDKVRTVTNINLIGAILGPVPSGFEARKANQ